MSAAGTGNNCPSPEIVAQREGMRGDRTASRGSAFQTRLRQGFQEDNANSD
jgi:hypothetical protein